MTVVVTHTTPADSTFSSTGAAAWNADHALSGVGTMAEQNANNVAITGGTINNTTVGATTPSTGVFTTLTATTAGTTTAKVWSNTNTSPIADLELQRGTNATWGGDAFTDYRIRATGGNFVLQSQNNTTSVLDLFTVDEANNAIKFSPVGVEQMRVTRTASAVNYVQVTGAATGNTPNITAQGSDTNIPIYLSSKGTGTVRFFTNGAGSEQFRVLHTAGTIVNYGTATGSATGSGPVFSVAGSDTNIDMNLTTKGTGTLIANLNGGYFKAYRDSGTNTVQVRSNGNLGLYSEAGGAILFNTNTAGDVKQAQVAHTASAVNYVQVTGAATGGAVNLSAQGSDTNIQLRFVSKGNQGISFFCRGGSAQQFSISSTNNAVNYLQATGAVASSSPILETAGTDTNIDLTLAPKGTGNVRFGTYTASILTPTGYVEIKDSGGTVRRLLVG